MEKLTSYFINKRFGHYRQLSGANYFASERQFIEAEKAIRVKSLIKFSKYSIKEVCKIMKTAGFVARSLKKRIKCVECNNILGSNEEISMPMVVDIPINRGGLIIFIAIYCHLLSLPFIALLYITNFDAFQLTHWSICYYLLYFISLQTSKI